MFSEFFFAAIKICLLRKTLSKRKYFLKYAQNLSTRHQFHFFCTLQFRYLKFRICVEILHCENMFVEIFNFQMLPFFAAVDAYRIEISLEKKSIYQSVNENPTYIVHT